MPSTRAASRSSAGAQPRLTGGRDPARRVAAPRRRVLIALYWWEDRIFEGVARVAAERGWILDCRMRWTHALPDLPKWRGDGIIANPGLRNQLSGLIRLIKRSGLPTVGLQSFGDYPCSMRVVPDHAAIGRMAAAHLLALGFRTIGYVTFADNAMERTRCEAFGAAVRTAGATFLEIDQRRLRRRLAALPKPFALWALNDRNAIDVAQACRDAGFRIPEEVAVLGTDDSRAVCDFAEVPLSSVNCSFEQQGYEAATWLHHLMEGGAPAPDPLQISPAGVTVRRSTDTVAAPDLAAVAAIRIMRDRFSERLSVPDIAREVGVSVRHLQKAFRQHLGFGISEELTRLRVARARELVADRGRKLDAIALDCGFSSRFHLIRAFQRETGTTPAAYRSARAGAAGGEA